jgi:hypothetical protein
MSPADKREKILARVRALLAKADSTTFVGEADAFRQKADELMAIYAIEQWQLRAAAERDARGGQPEKRDFDWSWTRRSAFRESLDRMFEDVLRHCRCVPVKDKASWKDGHIPVIGLPSDLDYADLLFTTLLLQLVAQIDPQPQAALSLEENVALLREAGLDWQETVVRLLKAGLLDARYGLPAKDDHPHPSRSRHRRRPNWYQRTAPKLSALYHSYCRREGRPAAKIDAKRYRQSFADGFVSEISSRLWRMEKKVATDNPMALALTDIYRANRQAVYDFFPELAPHARDCACDECERRRLSHQRWQEAQDRREARGRGRELAVYDRLFDRTDWEVREAGSKAGEAAEIISNAPRLRPRAALDK